jgi:putative phosphoribosyl transferase
MRWCKILSRSDLREIKAYPHGYGKIFRKSLAARRLRQIALISCKFWVNGLAPARERQSALPLAPIQPLAMSVHFENEVLIPVGSISLDGELLIPENAHGLVLFAHGSGSSRFSPRNQFVAKILREAGLGTLLFDLLTREEEMTDSFTRHLRFDIPLLAERLVGTTRWLANVNAAKGLKLGFFGSSTGGGAALVAAAQLGDKVGAVVSRGGRPDLASAWLPHVTSPTLLLVGELDSVVIELNRKAIQQMKCPTELQQVPNATHLFEEPGTLENAAHRAAKWFEHYLASQ